MSKAGMTQDHGGHCNHNGVSPRKRRLSQSLLKGALNTRCISNSKQFLMEIKSFQPWPVTILIPCSPNFWQSSESNRVKRFFSADFAKNFLCSLRRWLRCRCSATDLISLCSSAAFSLLFRCFSPAFPFAFPLLFWMMDKWHCQVSN